MAMALSKRVTWTKEEESVILRAGVEGLQAKGISSQFVFKGKEPEQVKTKAGNLRSKIDDYRKASTVRRVLFKVGSSTD